MKVILYSMFLIFLLGGCQNMKKANNNKAIYLNKYYVDADLGNDNNNGKDEDSPWKTLSKVSSMTFKPGDVIFIKRGTSYSAGLQLNGDGIKTKPITISAYGKGKAPSFTNTNDSVLNGNAIQLNGDYQIVENLYVHGTNPSTSGDYISVWKVGGIKVNLGADHAIIRNNEVFDCPIGINSYSDSCLITKNYVHDCNRVLHHPNWGPIGIRIGMGNTEISHNTIINYHSMGGTWGGDGGAIEVDDGRSPRNNIYIHHNKSSRCMGFCEMSYGFDICAPNKKDQLDNACKMGDCRTCKTENRIFNNIIFAYNESRDYRTFTQIWGPLRNSFIENNTIIRTLEVPDIESNVFCEFDPDSLASDSPTTYRNNLVVVVSEKTRMGQGDQIFLGYPMAAFKHSNNLFFNLSGSPVIFNNDSINNINYALGGIIADPLFVNFSEGDFHLTATSPAIDKGEDEGHYSIDLDGNPIDSKRDIGAYEYQK